MTCGLAIFVKTPGYSPLKTRLAAITGAAFAEDWHRRAADCIAAVVRQCPSIAPYWAVAEDAALADRCWTGFAALAQGEGELGERMARVHERVLETHRGSILIGADTPAISAELLDEAARWLVHDDPRLVIGRASDGGFWLFGANRPLPLPAWNAPRYGGTEVYQVLREAMADQGEWLELPTRDDLDRFEDLLPLIQQLAALPAPQPEQTSLLAWLCVHTFAQREGA
jgi:rSAM/selenodomain-associated transferase 1